MAKKNTKNNTENTVVIEEPIVNEPTAEEPTVETMEEVVGEATVPEKPEMTLLSTGIWTSNPTASIFCCDCGAERIIKTSDLFQVTRCAPCQKKAQNKIRAAKKKEANRTASLEKRIAEARKLLAEVDAQKANEE